MPGYVARIFTNMFRGFLRREEPLSPPDDMRSLWRFAAVAYRYSNKAPSALDDVVDEWYKSLGPNPQSA